MAGIVNNKKEGLTLFFCPTLFITFNFFRFCFGFLFRLDCVLLDLEFIIGFGLVNIPWFFGGSVTCRNAYYNFNRCFLSILNRGDAQGI